MATTVMPCSLLSAEQSVKNMLRISHHEEAVRRKGGREKGETEVEGETEGGN